MDYPNEETGGQEESENPGDGTGVDAPPVEVPETPSYPPTEESSDPVDDDGSSDDDSNDDDEVDSD